MRSSGGRKIYAMNMGKYESYIRDKELHTLTHSFTRIVVPFPIEFFFYVLGRTLSYDLELSGKMLYLCNHKLRKGASTMALRGKKGTVVS